jgi:8-oxo-dGTP diphosphatase
MASPANPHPSGQDIKVAVDAAIFTVREGKLCALAIKMKKDPYAGRWALPGGLLGDDETAEAAARRILAAQTGVTDVYLEQLRTFDAPARDPFGRVVSVASFALMPSDDVELRTTNKYAEVRWMPVAEMKRLAYDHDAVLAAALERVRARLGYTNIAWGLLPERFTLSRLQEVYESILGRPLDKRNFRKKILSLDLLAATGKKEAGGAHRPAALYRFRRRALMHVDIL